jgi:hypothetical protein
MKSQTDFQYTIIGIELKPASLDSLEIQTLSSRLGSQAYDQIVPFDRTKDTDSWCQLIHSRKPLTSIPCFIIGGAGLSNGQSV